MHSDLLHIDEHLRADDFSERVSEGPVSLWINSDQVSFHSVELPDAPKSKWASLLPWILEDQLLVSVEDLHLVICSVSSDRLADVASIPKVEMHRLQLLLESNSQQVHSLVPDIFALPLESGFLTVTKEGDRILVRSEQYQGFSGTQDFVWTALQLQHTQAVAQGQPFRIQCFGLDARTVPEWAEPLCIFNTNPINWQFSDVPTETNLLRGIYRAQRRLPKLSLWLPSIGLAALFVLLLCSWAVVDYVKSGRELIQINQQVLNEFEASFGQSSASASQVQIDAEALISKKELRYFAMAGSVMGITQSLDQVIGSCSDCNFERLQISVDNAILTMSPNDSAISRLNSLQEFTASSGALDESGQVQVIMRRSSP